MNAKDVLLEFVRQINAQNVDGLFKIMSEDHRFIDALGSTVQGREAMRQAWIGYFHLVPDYQISLEEIFENENAIAAFGTAGGTYSPNGELLEENRWQVPAAWRAEVRNNLLTEWRVYADNEPIRQLMAKANQ
jgi:hypothetical protein